MSVQNWKIQWVKLSFLPWPDGCFGRALSHCCPTSAQLGLASPDHREPTGSACLSGCRKILEMRGTLEIVSHEPAGVTDQECGQADLVEGLGPPLERPEHESGE